MGMTLQVEIQDLRRMLKEKCEEIISDKKLAYEFYCRICEIEEDNRFTNVDDLQDAVEPIPPTDESDLWKCGNCNHQLFRCTHQRYCEMCGKAVKW